MTLDGFIAGTNGELDWMVWDWDDELKNYVSDLTEPVDCIVLGRKMTPGFISYWEKVTEKPDDPEYTFGKKMMDTKKVVFTKTLEKSPWKNTELAKGDLADEIRTLKNQNGGDIIVYGGATFVSALIKAGIIDEFNLFVNPIAIGNGMSVFKELSSRQQLTLVQSKSFKSGIVATVYKPKNA